MPEAMLKQLEFWKKTALELAWRVSSGPAEAEAEARQRVEEGMMRQAREAMSSATASRAALEAAVSASCAPSSSRPQAAAPPLGNAAPRLAVARRSSHDANGDASSMHGSLPSLSSALGDRA